MGGGRPTPSLQSALPFSMNARAPVVPGTGRKLQDDSGKSFGVTQATDCDIGPPGPGSMP